LTAINVPAAAQRTLRICTVALSLWPYACRSRPQPARARLDVALRRYNALR
jgi:hypothetical protein